MTGKKFFIETFGCQMNELDSEKIAGHLRHGGMLSACDASDADVVILNTCSVREKAVQKAYSRLGQLKRRKSSERNLILGVVGCMAQLEGAELLQKAPYVDLVAGPQKGHALKGLIDQRLATGFPSVDLRMEEDPELLETKHVLRENRWSAGVKISEGCSRQCAFCVVPITRGKQRDRNSSSIYREAEQLAADAYLEVTLLGQTVTSYRDPSGRCRTFARLLRRVAAIEGLARIRFTAPHPSDISEELLEVMVSCPKVCDHIHLPVQSGSTRVLRTMRRGYTRDKYLRVVEKIKSAARPIALSTDIIVGFPGETAKDFEDTVSLLDEVQYDSIFSFKYSRRPNTLAFALSNEVPEEEKSRRLSLLQEQQKLIQYNKNAAYVGRTVMVLADDRARTNYRLAGRTSSNKIVNFDGPDDLLGSIVPVEVTGFSPNSLKGVWKREPVEEL